MSTQRRPPRRSALSGRHPAVPAPPPTPPDRPTDQQSQSLTDSVSTLLPEQRTEAVPESGGTGLPDRRTTVVTDSVSTEEREPLLSESSEPVGAVLTDPGSQVLADSVTYRPTEIQGNREPISQTSRTPDSGSIDKPESRTTSATESGGIGVPKWQRLQRKEARLREDQVSDLARLRRQLSRQRSQRPEPITDNTLIRVAVDLLLQHTDELAGDTEDELRASVLRNSRAGRDGF